MKKYDWLKLIGVRPLAPGETGPELPVGPGDEEDRESTVLDEARRNNHYASELLDMTGEPSDISLSPAELNLLRSIIGRELQVASLERMAMLQHKHHLREVKGLGDRVVKERIEFYDGLVADLRHLLSRLH